MEFYASQNQGHNEVKPSGLGANNTLMSGLNYFICGVPCIAMQALT